MYTLRLSWATAPSHLFAPRNTPCVYLCPAGTYPIFKTRIMHLSSREPALTLLPALVSHLPLSCIPIVVAQVGTRIGLLVNLPSGQRACRSVPQCPAPCPAFSQPSSHSLLNVGVGGVFFPYCEPTRIRENPFWPAWPLEKIPASLGLTHYQGSMATKDLRQLSALQCPHMKN